MAIAAFGAFGKDDDSGGQAEYVSKVNCHMWLLTFGTCTACPLTSLDASFCFGRSDRLAVALGGIMG